MFIIEGIIGAGKSTFLQLLKQHMPEISIAPEPVHSWEKQVHGQSLLSHFYQDTQRWAYTFELMTLMHRAYDYQLLCKQKNDNLFVERSLYSGYHCFAYNSFLQGFMSLLEWQLYQQWIDFLVAQNCVPPRGFIYLRVDPTIAYERIMKRSRHAEQSLSFEYLQQIYQRHEEFLLHRNHRHAPINNVPVLVLDVNKDFENDQVMIRDYIHQITNFMKV